MNQGAYLIGMAFLTLVGLFLSLGVGIAFVYVLAKILRAVVVTLGMIFNAIFH